MMNMVPANKLHVAPHEKDECGLWYVRKRDVHLFNRISFSGLTIEFNEEVIKHFEKGAVMLEDPGCPRKLILTNEKELNEFFIYLND